MFNLLSTLSVSLLFCGTALSVSFDSGIVISANAIHNTPQVVDSITQAEQPTKDADGNPITDSNYS